MRENMGLCRGKRTDNGEWVEGYFVRANGRINNRKCYILQEANNSRHSDGNVAVIGSFVEVYPSTVGQDTGLTDKNGKRIFEGDVVSGLFLYALPINGVCAFQNGAFGLEWERGGAKEFAAFTSMCNVEFEVIGNVHDIPELKGDC